MIVHFQSPLAETFIENTVSVIWGVYYSWFFWSTTWYCLPCLVLPITFHRQMARHVSNSLFLMTKMPISAVRNFCADFIRGLS